MDTAMLFDLWNTRPVRPRAHRTVGGVCAGIGHRYRVDPTLVKVAFVVSAVFGGGGILLYIACLIAFPSDDETAPPRLTPRQRRRSWGLEEVPWLWVVIVIAVIAAVAGMGSSPFWGSSGLVSILLMLVGWWQLYMRSPEAPAGSSADHLRPGGTDSGVGVGTAGGTVGSESVPIPADAYPPVTAPAPPSEDGPTAGAPPSWDPLGTATFAWDLPEPTPPPPPPTPQRSPVTLIFAGLAVLVATLAVGARLLGGVTWFTTGHVAALALVVLGIGMLVDSLQRRPSATRASGLVWLALIVGAVAVVATLTATGRPTIPAGGIGDRTWAPTGVEQLRHDYELSIGTSTLDLRGLRSLDRDRTVSVRQGIGDVTVLLPSHVRARAECTTRIGDQTCPEGIVNPRSTTPLLTVRVDVSMGSVEVKR